jgi:hypothetical protein
VELAEARERHLAPALEGVLDDAENCVDRLRGLLLAEPGPAGDLVDEL